MTDLRPFLYAAALLPDGRILAKLNMRDPARALDKFVVLNDGDEMYDEAFSHAVSYAKLLPNGVIELKARVVEDDLPSRLDSASRAKMQLSQDSTLSKKVHAIVGSMEVNKQVWFDEPKS